MRANTKDTKLAEQIVRAYMQTLRGCVDGDVESIQREPIVRPIARLAALVAGWRGVVRKIDALNTLDRLEGVDNETQATN